MTDKTNLSKDSLDNHIKRFSEYLRRDNKSRDTMESYGSSVKQFFNLISKQLKNINKNDLEKWKDYCQKYNNNSKTPKYGAIKKFIDYLIDANVLKPELYQITLKTLKAPKMRTDENNLSELVLDEEQYNTLFNIAKERNFRDYALLKTAFWCQLRRKEVMGLKINDINFKNLKVHLRAEITKGSKEATINISQECVDILNEYINNYRNKIKIKEGNEEYLFLNKDGKKLTESKIREIMVEYRVLTDNRNLHFHMMRHTGITAYSKIEKDVKMVQKQARHENSNVTMKYINYASEVYENSYRKWENSITNNNTQEKPKVTHSIETIDKPEEKPKTPIEKMTLEQQENLLLQKLLTGEISEETYKIAMNIIDIKKKQRDSAQNNYYG